MRRVAIALVFTVVLTACSEPPTKERDQAEGAIAAAKAAEAAIYAREELAAAEAALARYEAAAAQRDFRQALNAALDARDRAYVAAKQASSAKAASRSRAEHLVTEVTDQIKTAKGRLSGPTGARPAGVAADRLRAAIRAGTLALQESRTDMAKERYPAAVTRLEAVASRFRKELAPPAPTGGRRGRN